MIREEAEKALRDYERYIEVKGVDLEALSAYEMVARDIYRVDKDIERAKAVSRAFKNHMNEWCRKQTGGGGFWFLERHGDFKETELMYDLLKEEALYNFESYMYYLERKRPFERRFYLPRRCTQKIPCEDLQRLEDDELDVYGLSEPSRVGKTTIIVMFLSWVGLRKPMSHNAYGGHSGQLAKRSFKGLDNIVETDEYTYAELFTYHHPEMKKVVESKSSDPSDFTINLGKPDEFATFTFRGIDGTWTGAIDVSNDGYICIDDMIRDREHSLSPSRVENTYQEIQNKMFDRMNDGAKILEIGTRWCPADPLGREERLHENNPRALFRKIPALDENGESNFKYEVKGFSTKYYLDMRDRLEPPEWAAKFQQDPVVREGLVLPIDELNFFDGSIPDGKCRTVACLDVAFGGGDSVSMPVCKDFGDFKPIVGWVHDKRSPEYTVPKVVDAISRYMITHLWVEKNSGGQMYAEKIEREMDARGVTHCKLELYSAPVRMHKEDKITGNAEYVKRNFSFLRPKRRDIDEDLGEVYFADADYIKAVDEMTIWSPEGRKGQHDDAPDAITSLAMQMDGRSSRGTTAQIIPSLF